MPDFLPADEQFDWHAARLRALPGLRIAETWTVWDLEHDEWFADDVTLTPRAWVEWPLEWRHAAHPPLKAMAGVTLKAASAASFRFSTRSAADSHDVHTERVTAGLWLATDRGDLHIFNALDQNGLSDRPPSRDADLTEGSRPHQFRQRQKG